MLTKLGIKLLDFGLARLVEGDIGAETSEAPTRQRDLTKEDSIIGTLQYMAPEQLERKPADARTDIFAFGAVLYEMLTGRKAFAGEDVFTERQCGALHALVGSARSGANRGRLTGDGRAKDTRRRLESSLRPDRSYCFREG